jgi:hypothetical protein
VRWVRTARSTARIPAAERGAATHRFNPRIASPGFFARIMTRRVMQFVAVELVLGTDGASAMKEGTVRTFSQRYAHVVRSGRQASCS